MTLPGLFPRLHVEHVFAPCGWTVGQVVELKGARVLIGRDSSCDIQIDHVEVSRQHAEIIGQGGLCLLVDLGSRNGTLLDSEPLLAHQRRPLKQDQRIQIGQQVIFRFEDPNSTPTAEAHMIVSGDLALELSRCDVYVRGARLQHELNEIQFRVLEMCVREEPGKVLTYEQVIAAGWPGVNERGVSRNAVQSQISDLRSKLKSVAGDHEYIESIHGQGYRFKPRRSSATSPGLTD